MNKPELLAPAGSPEALDAAVAGGADAVYLGLKNFNARIRSANFAYSQFEGALKALHRMGKKVYVTVNTVFEQREGDRVYQLLKYLSSVGPDGIIVQDFGVLSLASEFPSLRLHASTQMNIACARGANALSKYGVSRVVLARELSLEEIRATAQGTNMELEVFVHGALCISASGLCLFSSYLGGKSANRGMCTQACRRLYCAESAQDGQDAKEAYYFSPCDLSLVSRLGELAEAGVSSFKIEGRMKSAEYTGAVVSAHRLVIDSLDAGPEQRAAALEDARKILRNDFARPKTEYFFGGAHAVSDWLQPDQAGGTGIPLGKILKVSGPPGSRRALVDTAGNASGVTPVCGDSVRFHSADDTCRLSHKLVFAEKDSGGTRISVPDDFEAGDTVYLIQTKEMSVRYPKIIPGDLSPFKRQPGFDKAPRAFFPGASPAGRDGKRDLPEGFFVAVSQPDDLYIVQSVKPAAVIVPLNRKSLPRLLGEGQPLPFKYSEIILALDPYFPQDSEAFLSDAVPLLRERGYRRFLLNNPGHFSLFSGGAPPPLLIAGPWLYTFNSWALSFTVSLGAAYAVTPLENNRQNLDRIMKEAAFKRSRMLITLFAWPPLFRIRSDLKKTAPFRRFSDKNGENFLLARGMHSSLVRPEKPFSILDKRPFLRESGFRRFIIDFSGGAFSAEDAPLKKGLYREVMNAAENCGFVRKNVSATTRFNWKNGFFTVQ